MLCEDNATSSDVMETGQMFVAAFYIQPLGTTISEARYRIYSWKTGKPMRIMALPPTEASLHLHDRITHFQMMLWKAANQQGPPTVDFRWVGR